MKRRNADFSGKIRRPIKRNKIDGICANSNFFFYLKFLLLWIVVITADFITELRFEYCWPFWLLLRSVYDSYKYKGLAFSFLFICIAITSDLICLFFIPVQWLFFAASTYVWIQYVWHTDKGICLPQFILWILFIYVEAKIRWKDNRNMPHLDLCRPFAAHCIGYPVVTLGFGFKSYVGYRIRQRKQRDVAKENEFYMQLLQQALPKDESAADGTNVIQESLQKDLIPVTNSNSTSNNNNINFSNNTTTTTTTTATKNAQNHKLFINNSSNNNNIQTNGHAVGAASNVGDGAPPVANGVPHKATTSRKSVEKENLNNNHEENLLNNKKNNHLNYNNLNNVKNNNNNSSYQYNSNYNNLKDINRTNEYQTQPQVNGAASGAVKSSPFKHNAKDLMEKDTIHNQFNTNTSTNKKEYEKDKFNKVSDFTEASGASGSSQRYETQQLKQKNEAHFVENQIKEKEKVQGKNNLCFQENNGTPDGPESGEQIVQTGRKAKHQQQKDNQRENTHDNSSDNSNNLKAKICEHCSRLEQEAKRLKSELNCMKNIENDMRSKVELNATIKACLQAKQKENEDLHNQIQDITNSRHMDHHNIQALERRLLDERRHRQQLESQLNNEKKMRKQLEEKLNVRPECSDACKMKKMHIENENNKLRREYKMMEESKQNVEKQNRLYEQELRKYEAEFRNRESSQNTEVLMSALAAMQEKNSTLEKNLSAETRVKLDLFSALGEARRQLEIKDSLLLRKDKQLEDLEGKTAQLLAVMPSMPSDSINLSNSVSPLMRLNDSTQKMSQLLPGDSSGAPQIIYSSSSSQATKSPSPLQQQQQQQQQQDSSNSNLDPNARAFNPLIAN